MVQNKSRIEQVRSRVYEGKKSFQVLLVFFVEKTNVGPVNVQLRTEVTFAITMRISHLHLIKNRHHYLSSSLTITRDVILQQLGVLGNQCAPLFRALTALTTAPFNGRTWHNPLVTDKLSNMDVVKITRLRVIEPHKAHLRIKLHRQQLTQL